MGKKLVEIVWLDATDGEGQKEEVKCPRHELMIQKTYGLLYDEDKKAIIVLGNEDEEGKLKYTVIPKCWIKRRIIYESDRKTKRST